MKTIWARACVLALLVLSGCSTGVPEFGLYQQAYEAQYAESARVLDRLGTAEAILRERRAAAEPGIAPFDPDRAGQLLGLDEPPLTAGLRRSLDALKSFNDALSGLATGEAAAVLSARIGSASAALSAASQSILAAGGLAIAAVSSLEGSVAAALPVLERLAAISDRARFRDALLEAYPDMRALLVALRAGTPDLFEVMLEARKTPGSLSGVDGVARADLPLLEEDRRLLAGWVVLLDETLRAMDLAATVIADPAAQAGITALTEAAVEVQTLADIIKALRKTN
ncbi:MAG: hypothetical protein AAGC92_00535 [Pseudomonadota bacterium]